MRVVHLVENFKLNESLSDHGNRSYDKSPTPKSDFVVDQQERVKPDTSLPGDYKFILGQTQPKGLLLIDVSVG